MPLTGVSVTGHGQSKGSTQDRLAAQLNGHSKYGSFEDFTRQLDGRAFSPTNLQ